MAKGVTYCLPRSKNDRKAKMTGSKLVTAIDTSKQLYYLNYDTLTIPNKRPMKGINEGMCDRGHK